MNLTISAKEADNRRQRIRDTAYILFKDRGVDSVTYHDVSAHSGISEASIYHYYKKKSYLLLEAYRYLWIEIASELEKATAYNDDYQMASGFMQIECIINAFEQVYIDHGEYLKFAVECKLYWNRQSFALDDKEYDSILDPVFRQFSRALKKGVDDHSIHLDADYRSCCFLLWGILHAYTEQMVIFDGFHFGANRYKVHFQTMKNMLLKSLRG